MYKKKEINTKEKSLHFFFKLHAPIILILIIQTHSDSSLQHMFGSGKPNPQPPKWGLWYLSVLNEKLERQDAPGIRCTPGVKD